MQLIKRVRSSKGSIAVYVSIVIISMLLILLALFFTSNAVRRNQLTTAMKVKETYEADNGRAAEIYENLVENMPIKIADVKGGEAFTEKTTVEDEKGNKIVVPEGFKIASDSGDTVEQGVVIEDVNASTDEEIRGSQFVWIPVGKFIKDDGTESNEIILGRYTFSTSSPGTPTLEQAAYTDENFENYKEEIGIEVSNAANVEFIEYSGLHRDGTIDNSNHLNDLNATANNMGEWIDSVRENGGYYIGRYEASFASGSSVENYKAATKISTGYRTETDGSMLYNSGTLWNWILQIDASKVAINTYKDSRSVKSDLMNSYAWDTAIVYIQECGNTNYANQIGKSLNNNLANTGTNDDEVCKINDMGSNLREWTTEWSSNASMYSAFPCTSRGGDYKNNGDYTAHRGADGSTGSFGHIGFRLSLYM